MRRLRRSTSCAVHLRCCGAWRHLRLRACINRGAHGRWGLPPAIVIVVAAATPAKRMRGRRPHTWHGRMRACGHRAIQCALRTCRALRMHWRLGLAASLRCGWRRVRWWGQGAKEIVCINTGAAMRCSSVGAITCMGDCVMLHRFGTVLVQPASLRGYAWSCRLRRQLLRLRALQPGCVFTSSSWRCRCDV